MMMKFGIYLVLCLWVYVSGVRAQCPTRCLCFRTTVRCMFLQMQRIPRVPPDTTILDLRFNVIKDIPRGAFEDMKHLDTLLLNNNELETIRDGAFQGLHELRYLYLYKNKIRTIESKAFKHMHKLEQLFLHGNELERLPPGLFSYNKKLKRLRLDSNALICDCEMIWLAQMLKDNGASTQAAATCDYPGSLRGRSLASINLAEFDCNTYQDADMPRITSQPSDVEVTFGSTVSFICRADGSPEPQILWMHNNEFVDPSQGHYSILDDGTLMIEDARHSDQGSYECIARNSAGEVKTDTVELRMHHSHDSAPEFTVTPSDIHVVVGETVDLQCAAEGHPHPEITWTFNGNSVRLNSRLSIVGGGLHLASVREDDRGLYRCRAENSEGIITATARISVQILPHFILRPVDVSLPEGSTAVFQCDAMGDPNPVISWYSNGRPLLSNDRVGILDSGRTLRVASVTLEDGGVYVCTAESAAGRMEASAELQVTSQVAPSFRRRVEEIEADAGDDVLLDCSADGQPSPQFRWMKEGSPLRNGRKYLAEGSTLTIRQAITSDEGLYECFAENSLGFARNSLRLVVNAPVRVSRERLGDQFVNEAIRTATDRVDKSINATRARLFQRGRQHSVEELISVFRYPTADALELARAEEIFEQTLEIIHDHVQAGHDYALDNHTLTYKELVSPSHLALIANMSGCFRRTLPQRCTNMCFHKKYRTLDGSCNNLQNPSWGSAHSPLKRLLEPIYENGFNAPVGWNRGRLYKGTHLPSARLVSSVMMSTEAVSTDNHETHMLMQWGQFLDHDIALTPQAVGHHTFSDGRQCNETCENSFPCFPIPVPTSDSRVRSQPCLGFHRSSATCNTGTTSVFFKTFAPRQQLNAITAYIDGSQIYGSTEDMSERLRDTTHPRGHLLVGSLGDGGKRLLPYDFHGILGAVDCQIESSKRYIPCFLAGDIRANEQVALTSVHTLFMREHNRIATELQTINPHWDGNMLYHEARKIVSGMLQHITFTGWLPKIIGVDGAARLGQYRGYDPTVDSSITNEFATAAMRFGHGLIQPIIFRLNESFQQVSEGHLPLHKAFFSPYRIVEEGGIDPILRGLFAQGAKMRMPTEIMNSELTEKLFALANRIGLDLASLNIQRGRDHALPFYNEYRELCNLTKAQSFDDLRNEIHDRATRENLDILYGHVDNIDLFVGGMAERPLPGAKIGPTFMCILVDQFKRIRDGDRFWYEDPMVFNPDQLKQIQQTSLARVICDSSDDITHVQRDVFTMVHSRDEYISCDEITTIDLKMWSECCMDCGKAGDFQSITSHFRRRRHSEQYTYRNDGGAALAEFENFRDTVYNKNEMDTKMHHVQNKLSNMETVMQQMEYSVKKLKRNMRRMMSHSGMSMSCTDEDGGTRQHGDKWLKDDCTTCKCRMGKVKCRTESCPPPTCDFPKTMPGICCQIC